MANNEASDLVEAALNEAIKSMDDHDDGDLLVEWALIAYVANPEKDKGDGYPMLFSNGNIPTYRARGLFYSALEQLSLLATMLNGEEE